MSNNGMTFSSATTDPRAFVVASYTMIADTTYGFLDNASARLFAKDLDSRNKSYGPHMDAYRPFGFWKLKESK